MEDPTHGPALGFCVPSVMTDSMTVLFEYPRSFPLVHGLLLVSFAIP